MAFEPASLLTAADVPYFLAEALHDGDPRVLPVALRTVSGVIGMTELARRTGLSRETLYRTLSERGNPRLDTLHTILSAFGLRLSVEAHTATRPASAMKGSVRSRKTAVP